MRTHALFLVLVLTLPACAVRTPDIPLTETAAGPLVNALEQRRSSFTGLKAVARVQTERSGRKRSYESVAILVKDQEKMKIEAYGPLGQPLLGLSWNGADIQVRKPGEEPMMLQKQSGIERLTGIAVDPEELCAVLSGNMPRMSVSGAARAGCAADGQCFLDVRQDGRQWRFQVIPGAGSPADLQVLAMESYQRGRLQYRASYENTEVRSSYRMPTRIVLSNADKKMSLTVIYEDIDVNPPLLDNDFILTGDGDRP